MKPEFTSANRVRVSLPASVAADIGSLKKAVGSILDKLGCPACCSGHDIFFELQRDFFIADKPGGKAQPFQAFRSRASARRAAPAVRVGIAPAAANEIKEVYAAIDRIAELTGHPACATGCDMFLNVESSLVMDANLGIEELALTVGRR